MNEIKAIENKMNELASKVLNSEQLQGFIELDVIAKVMGIKLFAILGDDKEIIKMCEYAEKVLSQK